MNPLGEAVKMFPDGLDRIWATWRREYVSGETGKLLGPQRECVLCAVRLAEDQPESLVYCGDKLG